jgi:hypothetical protein
MPTFTGETGERIRALQDFVDGLRKGTFAAFLWNTEIPHPGGNLFIVNDTQEMAPFDSAWYDETTGRYTPKIRGWYHLTAGVTIKAPVPTNLVGCSINMYRTSGGGNTQSFLMNTLQHIPTYGYKATKITLSGSCVLWADGVDYSFQPSVVMDGAAGTISPNRRNTYFHGHLIVPT